MQICLRVHISRFTYACKITSLLCRELSPVHFHYLTEHNKTPPQEKSSSFQESACFVLSTQGNAGIYCSVSNLNKPSPVLFPISSHSRGPCEPFLSLLFKNVFSSTKLILYNILKCQILNRNYLF